MAAVASSPTPADILHRLFGFPGFRGQQEQVVTRVLAGQRTLAIMPTGAGKSLCYQLPAVIMDGTCIVISPLIALMHDQMRAADAVGIRAATLTSADDNRAETISRFRAGELDLLYVAPERASGQEFRSLLRETKISLFAIDEAHCVSEWGHDFRPDYRLLRPLLDDFAEVPRLALTKPTPCPRGSVAIRLTRAPAGRAPEACSLRVSHSGVMASMARGKSRSNMGVLPVAFATIVVKTRLTSPHPPVKLRQIVYYF